MASGVSRTEVRDDGLVATLFRPPVSGPRPMVIVVGGSGGGLWETPAALLASHGFVAGEGVHAGFTHQVARVAEPAQQPRALSWKQAHSSARNEALKLPDFA